MPFGRRICEPRRVVLALEKNGVPISGLVDSVVDQGKSDLVAYCKSLWDIQHLTLAGEPTWWTIKPLTLAQMQFVSNLRHSAAEFNAFMVRAGLVKVENYQLQNDHGQALPFPRMKLEKLSESIGDVLSDAWMSEVHFHQDIMSGLASMILEISEVHLPLSLPSAPESGVS